MWSRSDSDHFYQWSDPDHTPDQLFYIKKKTSKIISCAKLL